MVILLDAMGGDNAPDANIKGAIKAIKDISAEVCLVGNKDIIASKIKEFYGKMIFQKYHQDLVYITQQKQLKCVIYQHKQ